MQHFTSDEQHLIQQGAIKQQTLRALIDEALNNNQFNQNYIISSLPGLGKSYEMEQALAKCPNPPLLFEGAASISAFTIEVATARYLLPKNQRMVVVLDDCDTLFEKKNINITKKMFDSTQSLKYGKNFRGLRHLCTDLQYEAIESFSSDDKAGFSVPTDNITFIILTNRHLCTVNEAEEGNEYAADSYAIRRRVEYKDIDMTRDQLWGYVANVVMNEQICEKFIPNIDIGYKLQILNWCSRHWDNCTERNLSLVEKMTKDIVRYPKIYKDIWDQNYL